MTDIVHPVHDTNCMKTINTKTQTSNDSTLNTLNNMSNFVSNTMPENSVNVIESISTNNEIIEDITQSFFGIQNCVEHKENLHNCDSDSTSLTKMCCIFYYTN